MTSITKTIEQDVFLKVEFILNASTASLGDEKRGPHNLFLIFGSKQNHWVQKWTIRWMTNVLVVLVAQKVTCLSRCVKLRIVAMEDDPFLLIAFPYFFKNF